MSGVVRRALLAAASSLLSAAAAAQSVTWHPDLPSYSLKPGEAKQITCTVCLPGQVSKADIYLLADTTTSMNPVLDSVKANAVVLVDLLVNTPGVDLHVGVGQYRDFPFNALPFEHQVSPGTDAVGLVAAINTWSAGGGGDGSEGQLYALYKIATDPTIGFRPDAKRIVVWFGDSPGHDPICDIFVGGGVPSFEITEQVATDALVNSGPEGGITVIAIGTQSSASFYPDSLNDDPLKSVYDYFSPPGIAWCTAGGLPGQANRIAIATTGISTTITDPSQITSTILQTLASVLIAADVTITASPALLPFIQSINPLSYDDLLLPHDPTTEVCVDFSVRLKGPPCSDTFIASGALEVLLNGTPLDTKVLTVAEPACFNALGLIWAGLRRLDPPLQLPGGDPFDVLHIDAQVLTAVVPLGVLPVFSLPSEPALQGLDVYFQCAMKKASAFPNDPLKTSNGLRVTFGDPGLGELFGLGSGLTLLLDQPALVPGTLALECVLN
jgi:hypothetical protein